jgi:hypothetical protein
MSHFVSVEIYAIRNYVTAHPETTPQDRIGFAWAPVAADPGYSKRGRNMILTRLASAIRAAYEEEANSQLDACGPTGQNVWCTGDVDGAFLNDAWKTFTLWE